ncbi:PKD repeat-containing protein [Pedobacter nyackensis]|uniref:PKD repeat-containing protein n=2 Tax=Pedobacter nyackensis TaxID=475255 RepID=A0A1W2C396_9SPHI|nr:PKD repeat-containing protein [Pedobacter nyackensis]
MVTSVYWMSCKKNELQELKADFSASTQEVKAGAEVVFTDVSEGQPASWNWVFEGGIPETSNLSTPTVRYDKPGTYAVTLVLKNGSQESVGTKEGFITVGYNDVNPDFEASIISALEGETIKFTDKTTGLPQTWNWEFRSKDGATVLTATQQNPEVKFMVPGIYTAKLVASNPKSSKEIVKTDYLTIIDKFSVIAEFESEATATYGGGQIQFTDKSIGNATSWAWTFEGATQTSSNAQNPKVTYPTAGRFKVKLVASNPVKSSTIEKESYVLVVPSSGLSAFFPFNGNVKDVGPSGTIGTVTGTIAFTAADRKSVTSNVAEFNGASYIVVNDHAAYNFGKGDYSVATWIKTNRTNRMLIWMESGGLGSKDNQTWLRLGANTTTQLIGFATEDAVSGSFLGMSEAEKGKMYDNVWHHVVCVRQGLVTRVYVDGVKAKEVTSTNGIKEVSNTGNFKIGAQEGATSFSNYFNGQLDDMIIYKKALSQAEITALFNL